MKSIISALILALVGSSIAAPSQLYNVKRQSSCEPSAKAVLQALQSWNHDVTYVNTFLDLASGQNAEQLLITAEETLSYARDEPNELDILACIGNLASLTGAPQAITTLRATFGNVLTKLQNIIDNPGDANVVATDLQVINNVRCCNVLKALDVLWEAAANDQGITDQVNTVVPRPNACSTVVC